MGIYSSFSPIPCSKEGNFKVRSGCLGLCPVALGISPREEGSTAFLCTSSTQLFSLWSFSLYVVGNSLWRLPLILLLYTSDKSLAPSSSRPPISPNTEDIINCLNKICKENSIRRNNSQVDSSGLELKDFSPPEAWTG